MMIEIALAGLTLVLPDRAEGWTASAPPARYDPQSIFHYIDGHGEVYLAYGMVACTAQRYAGPPGEGAIVVDVFELESAADAYGVFTHSRDGDPVPVGQDASLAFGTLLYWKGREFVSVTAEQETERAKAAVVALGHAVDEAIGERGEVPPLVQRLPAEGLDARSVVWLRNAHILDAHARLGRENVLGVGSSAPAALGRYRRTDGVAELVLVSYPDQASAARASAAFADRFLAPARPRRHQDGWYAAGAGSGLVRAFVLRASSRQTAESLLAAVAKEVER